MNKHSCVWQSDWKKKTQKNTHSSEMGSEEPSRVAI